MSQPAVSAPPRPADIPEPEWLARLQLAACYRLFDWLGWAELIFNHITVRVAGPGEAPCYLINPFGLHYAEVTARNLLKIDVDGRVIGESAHPVNPAGFLIHSVVHRHRHDAQCVMHTHTTSGMAVACKAEGLRHDNFYSAQLHGRIAYHPFEGVTTNPDEGPRIAASLGDKDVLILRNHGLLALGPTLPAAFSLLWTLQRGCDVQLAADSLRGPNQAIEPAVLAAIPAQCAPMQAGSAPGQLMFEGILRRAGIVYADLAA